MRLVQLREIPEDENLRQQWNALVSRVDQPQIFYTWEWAVAVQRAYVSSLRPLLFLAYDERDSLCGVVTLATDTDGGEASFLCAATGDYCDFLASPEQKPALVSAVLTELKKDGVGAINLTNLPVDSNTVPALQQASARRSYHYFSRIAYVCTQVLLSKLDRRPGDSIPAFPRKSALRRLSNAMGREAPLRLDHARSWDAVEPLLEPFIHAHVARFLTTGRISNLARPERKTFLAELARLLCPRNWLVLTRMMAGTQVVAWNYGFQFEHARFWYQPTFDSIFEKYSPGFCLLTMLIAEAAQNPELTLVDLGLGSEEYKDRVSNQARQTLNVILNRSAVRHCQGILRSRLVEMVTASTRAEVIARAIRERWRRIWQSTREQGTVGTLSWIGRRFRDLLWSQSEVFFYEWSGSVADEGGLALQRLGLGELACAVEQYVDDEATLNYLVRSSARLRQGNAQGFGLIDQNGRLLHFAWITPFEGFFLAELNAAVNAPSPDSVMLFDCWTPSTARGHGYYGQTIALIAERLRKSGKPPWIFSASGNIASTRGLEKAGFQRRYSLIRRHALWWQRIKIGKVIPVETGTSEVSARA